MKRVFKFLSALLSTLLLVVMFTACTGEENPTTGIAVETDKDPVMTDEQIVNNFDKEIKKLSLSKNSINSAIKTAISEVSLDADVDSILAQLNVPNSKVTLNYEGKEVDGEEVSDNKLDASLYLWQNGDVAYASNNVEPKQTYSLNCATIKTYLKNLYDTTSGIIGDVGNVDFVSLLLEALKMSELDIDSILSLIKFNGSDFTYSNGVFTLSKDTLIDKMISISTPIFQMSGMDNQAIAQVRQMMSSIFTDIYAQVGYNGTHFTSFKLYAKVDVAVVGGAEGEYIEVTFDSQFGYSLGKLVMVVVTADVNLYKDEANTVNFDANLTASTKGLEFNFVIDGIITNESYVVINYEKHPIINVDVKKTNVYLYIDFEEKTINLDFNDLLTDSTTYKEDEAHKEEFKNTTTLYFDSSKTGATFDYNYSSSLDITENNESQSETSTKKIFVKLETGVEVPADVKATEATAIDMTQSIIDEINDMMAEITK